MTLLLKINFPPLGPNVDIEDALVEIAVELIMESNFPFFLSFLKWFHLSFNLVDHKPVTDTFREFERLRFLKRFYHWLKLIGMFLAVMPESCGFEEE